mmetsp:Transcript_875/g.2030  ORF Transcript_875/g.2030 Transcript_875/m.2030 type:complete len:90 (-) Transcript_875:434-703(-)
MKLPIVATSSFCLTVAAFWWYCEEPYPSWLANQLGSKLICCNLNPSVVRGKETNVFSNSDLQMIQRHARKAQITSGIRKYNTVDSMPSP